LSRARHPSGSGLTGPNPAGRTVRPGLHPVGLIYSSLHFKRLYLAVREQINPNARDANHVAAHWKEALNQFALFFEDRLSIQ
jgi:hypothetical protein